MSALMVGMLSSPAWGQLIDLNQIFDQASSVGSRRIGNLEIAPVYLDGRRLFQVAAPAANRQAEGGISIDWRVREIEFKLQDIVKDGIKGDLEVRQEKRGEQYVISVSHEGLDRPQQVLTVTRLDAKVDEGEKTLAGATQRRAKIIYDSLIRAKEERTPAYIQTQLVICALILVGMGAVIATSIAVRKFSHTRFQKKIQETSEPEDDDRSEEDQIEDSKELSSETIIEPSPYRRYRFPKLPSIKFNLYAQLDRAFRYLSTVINLATLVGGTVLILRSFPQTRSLSNWLFAVPTGLIFIPVGMIGVKGILDWLALYSVNRWLYYLKEFNGGDDRTELRAQTILRVLKDLIGKFVWLAGALVFFAVLGILPLGLLLLAVLTFSSQGVLQDWLQGAIILLEDHYATGDVVAIEDTIGAVEFMNLRVTQLRTIDGRLVSISNSKIDRVGNLTSRWSRADLIIDVAYDTDLDFAIDTIRQVAEELQNDEEWQELIIEDPVVLGVDNFGESSISIRMLIKTKPAQHMVVAREYRRRLKPAFDRAGITIPFPQQSIWFENPVPERGSAAQPDEDPK